MKTIIKLSEKHALEYDIDQVELGYKVKCYLLEDGKIVKEMDFYFDDKPSKTEIIAKIAEKIKG